MTDEVIRTAYGTVLQTALVSVDELIATPEYRECFLRAAREGGSTAGERDLLMCLINLRKRSRLPRISDITLTPADG